MRRASLYLNLKKPRARIPRAPVRRRCFDLAATLVRLTPETHLQGGEGSPHQVWSRRATHYAVYEPRVVLMLLNA